MFDLSKKKKDKQQPQQQLNQSYAPVLKGAGPRMSSLPALRSQQQFQSQPITPKYDFSSGLRPSHASTINTNPVIGENLFLTNTFPIHQNDAPALKGIKGLGNFATSVFSAPGELLRKASLQGGSILTGGGIRKDLLKNTSFTQDILPRSASSKLNNFQQQHPIAGTIANMALEIGADPTSYLTGSSLNKVINPKSIGELPFKPLKFNIAKQAEQPIPKTSFIPEPQAKALIPSQIAPDVSTEVRNALPELQPKSNVLPSIPKEISLKGQFLKDIKSGVSPLNHEYFKGNIATLKTAKTGESIDLTGFRQNRGQAVDGTGKFYSVSPTKAAAYGDKVNGKWTELGPLHTMGVDPISLKNPLVVDGGHWNATRELLDGLGPNDPLRKQLIQARQLVTNNAENGTEVGYTLYDKVIAKIAKQQGYDGLVYRHSNTLGDNASEVIMLNKAKTVAPISDVLKGTTDVTIPVKLPSNKNIISAANMEHLPQTNNTASLSVDLNNPVADTTLNKYVDTNPININIGKNDKATSLDIRNGYVGKLNKQIVTGNQLSDTMKALAPKEQEGIQLFIDAGGDKAHLQEMAKSTDPIIDSFIPNTKTTYREAYNQALNLSPEAQKAAAMAQQYYKEAGQYALQTGSTKSVLENYANRLWKQPPTGTVNTELRKPGLNPFTSHSKERVYYNIGEGILNGKEPVTLNAGNLLGIHNEELARVNTNRGLAEALKSNGLGNYQVSKPPAGFTAIDSMGKDAPVVLKDGTASIVHQSFVIPDGIAKGLRSITDPNYMAKVDAFKHLQAYQGLVKTVDLSFSLFHHITLAAQALYNSHGGVDFVRNWDKMSKLGSETFNASEKWGAEHGLMTTKIDSNYDILRQISGNKVEGKLKEQLGIMKKAEWTANKLGNLPVIKQAGQLADKNTEFLFGKIQRWLKVSDFQNKANAFVGKNPNMQNAEVTKGLRQIASEVNDAYGGLNWKAIGVTPSMQALSRLGLLAPDWTFSSARILAKTLTKGPGGAAARAQFTGGIIGAGILTEGLNNLLTGHYTDQNAKGHELEVEVQPGVYISMFRSGIGDTTKLFANIGNNGLLSGTIGTLQGKMSPLARTLVGQLSNKQPAGAPITSVKNTPLQNDLARLGSFGSSFLPIPMGIPSMKRYIDSGTATPLGSAFVSTGAARYSKTVDINTLANPASFNSGNWIDKLNPSSGPQLKQTKKKIK